MKIKFARAVMAAFIMAAVLAPTNMAAKAAVRESQTAVIYNGLLMEQGDVTITENGAIYISLGDVAKIFGGTATWDGKTKTATLKTYGTTAKMKAGKAEMEINYTKKTAPMPPVIYNGRMYVPALYFFGQLYAPATYDETAGAIRVNDNKAAYSVYDKRKAAYAASLAAEKKPVKEITTAEAVGLVVAKNAALNDAKANKTLLERRKKEIDETVDKMIPADMNYSDYYEYYFQHSQSSKTTFTKEEVDLLRSQQKVNNQIESISLTEKTIRESAKTQIVSQYIDIEKAFADIYMAEERLGYDEKQLATAKLKESIGYEGRSNVISLEASVAKDKLSLEQLRLKLESAKNTLCDTLGLPVGTVITLTDFNAADTKHNKDYEAFAAERIKASPSVALKTLDYRYAQYEESSYRMLLREEDKPYRKSDEEKRDIEIQNENAVNSAKAAVTEAKDAVLGASRARLQNIESLSQNNDSLKLDYEAAKRNYDAAVTSYLAGGIALNDVNGAKLKLFSAEASLYQNSLSLRAAVEAYRNIF